MNFGGYDLLLKPFEATEVFRVVSTAWLSWKNKWQSANHARKPPKSAGRKASAMKASAGFTLLPGVTKYLWLGFPRRGRFVA